MKKSQSKTASLFYDKMSTPASQTKEGKARLRAYHLALGTFIDAFAKVEIAMHLALRWHTKTQHDIARAVFAGTRASQTMDHLRRLAEIEFISAAEWAQLAPVLSQLRLINGRRNTILHYGADEVADGRGISTDALVALTSKSAKSFPVSPKILRDMTWDLRKILLQLVMRHLGRPALRGKHPKFDRVIRAAWRYKQSQPSVQKQPRR